MVKYHWTRFVTGVSFFLFVIDEQLKDLAFFAAVNEVVLIVHVNTCLISAQFNHDIIRNIHDFVI